jgi:hypothetical protein
MDGTRQNVLAMLWGREPVFRLNGDALAWLVASKSSPSVSARLNSLLLWEQELSAIELSTQMAEGELQLRVQQRQQVRDALSVAAYHTQSQAPIVHWLLSDDADVYHDITDAHALCWVHDARHYKKFSPVVVEHQRLLADFRREHWAFYYQLLAYRANPSSSGQNRLTAAFDQLAARQTGYDDLDVQIAKTGYHGDLPLAILDNPDLPLHNNDVELTGRQRVRKRAVSFGSQSAFSAQAWDSFQTIVATTAKLGVRLYEYLRQRLIDPGNTPSLADRIRERASLASLKPT